MGAAPCPRCQPEFRPRCWRARPDLRAAEARLRATLAAVDEVRLSFYPTASLTGTLGSSSVWLAEVLENPLATLGYGLPVVSLFVQWNTLNLELNVAEAEYEQAVMAFRQSLYAALGEVEKALSARTRHADEARYLEESLTLARESERLSEIRYRAGAIGLADWLAASQLRRGAEADLASNRLNQLTNLMELFQALGGAADRRVAAVMPVNGGQVFLQADCGPSFGASVVIGGLSISRATPLRRCRILPGNACIALSVLLI